MYASSLKNSEMITNIMYPSYKIYDMGDYKKYQNENFDIFTKKNSIIMVRDKRDINNIIIYNDIKTAYYKIFNTH